MEVAVAGIMVLIVDCVGCVGSVVGEFVNGVAWTVDVVRTLREGEIERSAVDASISHIFGSTSRTS